MDGFTHSVSITRARAGNRRIVRTVPRSSPLTRIARAVAGWTLAIVRRARATEFGPVPSDPRQLTQLMMDR